MQWEFIDVSNGTALQRLAVPGGWLYRMANREQPLTFVPDPEQGDKVKLVEGE